MTKPKHVSLKLLGESFMLIGEPYFYLSNNSTDQTLDALDCKVYEDRFAANGNGHESPGYFALAYHFSALTDRTSKGGRVLVDGENDRSMFVSRPNVSISNNTESMIKKTRGHACLSFIIFFKTTKDKACPLLLCNLRYANPR
jgi:hypothetical protein